LLYGDSVFLGAGDKCISGGISGEWHFIQGRRTWGRMINGSLFLAVHDDDLLTVYRMRGQEP
jgi:hypothetical protein